MTTERVPADSARALPSGGGSGTAPGDRIYRPDVEGLRAVAVALVVLYHFSVPPFTGGLVGVDVFFVISGFVITGLLLREQEKTAKNALLDFYARRARRILPAATLVIFATVAAAYMFAWHGFGPQTANDGRWSAAFLANVHLATGPLSALDNYWSLAVEEQFYLLYPSLVLFLATLKTGMSLRARIAVALAPLALASLVLCASQNAFAPTWVTYSLFARAWELALGALVAVSTTHWRRLSTRWSPALTWLGMVGIVIAAVTFNSRHNYPGTEVILPALGTAFVIAGGTPVPRLGAEWLLGSRPFRWLGQRSYSLYLWHWPVLIVAAAAGVAKALHLGVWPMRIILMAASVLLAMVTYRWVENPLRQEAPVEAVGSHRGGNRDRQRLGFVADDRGDHIATFLSSVAGKRLSPQCPGLCR